MQAWFDWQLAVLTFLVANSQIQAPQILLKTVLKLQTSLQIHTYNFLHRLWGESDDSVAYAEKSYGAAGCF